MRTLDDQKYFRHLIFQVGRAAVSTFSFAHSPTFCVLYTAQVTAAHTHIHKHEVVDCINFSLFQSLWIYLHGLWFPVFFSSSLVCFVLSFMRPCHLHTCTNSVRRLPLVWWHIRVRLDFDKMTAQRTNIPVEKSEINCKWKTSDMI